MEVSSVNSPSVYEYGEPEERPIGWFPSNFVQIKYVLWSIPEGNEEHMTEEKREEF